MARPGGAPPSHGHGCGRRPASARGRACGGRAPRQRQTRGGGGRPPRRQRRRDAPPPAAAGVRLRRVAAEPPPLLRPPHQPGLRAVLPGAGRPCALNSSCVGARCPCAWSALLANQHPRTPPPCAARRRRRGARALSHRPAPVSGAPWAARARAAQRPVVSSARTRRLARPHRPPRSTVALSRLKRHLLTCTRAKHAAQHAAAPYHARGACAGSDSGEGGLRAAAAAGAGGAAAGARAHSEAPCGASSSSSGGGGGGGGGGGPGGGASVAAAYFAVAADPWAKGVAAKRLALARGLGRPAFEALVAKVWAAHAALTAAHPRARRVLGGGDGSRDGELLAWARVRSARARALGGPQRQGPRALAAAALPPPWHAARAAPSPPFPPPPAAAAGAGPAAPVQREARAPAREPRRQHGRGRAARARWRRRVRGARRGQRLA